MMQPLPPNLITGLPSPNPGFFSISKATQQMQNTPVYLTMHFWVTLYGKITDVTNNRIDSKKHLVISKFSVILGGNAS